MMDWQRLLETSVIPVVVALLGGGYVFRRHDKKAAMRAREALDQNSSEHQQGQQLIRHLSTQVGSLDAKVDRIDQRIDDLHVWRVTHDLEHDLEP